MTPTPTAANRLQGILSADTGLRPGKRVRFAAQAQEIWPDPVSEGDDPCTLNIVPNAGPSRTSQPDQDRSSAPTPDPGIEPSPNPSDPLKPSPRRTSPQDFDFGDEVPTLHQCCYPQMVVPGMVGVVPSTVGMLPSMVGVLPSIVGVVPGMVGRDLPWWGCYLPWWG